MSCGEHVVDMTQVTQRACNIVIAILRRDTEFACVLVLVIMKFDIVLHDTTCVKAKARPYLDTRKEALQCM